MRKCLQKPHSTLHNIQCVVAQFCKGDKKEKQVLKITLHISVLVFFLTLITQEMKINQPVKVPEFKIFILDILIFLKNYRISVTEIFFHVLFLDDTHWLSVLENCVRKNIEDLFLLRFQKPIFSFIPFKFKNIVQQVSL